MLAGGGRDRRRDLREHKGRSHPDASFCGAHSQIHETGSLQPAAWLSASHLTCSARPLLLDTLLACAPDLMAPES